MEYKIIHDGYSRLLQQTVKGDIADGWVPCGGVSVSETYDQRRGGTHFYSQAMIRTWWTKTLRNFR